MLRKMLPDGYRSEILSGRNRQKRADEMCKAERLYREGKLPKRVCHCDTKVNNMMFDEDGKVALCHRPGYGNAQLCLLDYGDFLRTGANTGDEDDKDLIV